MEVCLSLGSNLGNRLLNLQDCRDQLSRSPGISMVSQSAIYETEPVDVPDEYEHLSFLNAVVLIETHVPIEELFFLVKSLERSLSDGQAHSGNSPRLMDIDMIYADDVCHESSTLTLPHPRAHLRRFVLEPLSDIRPEFVFPGKTTNVQGLLFALPDKPSVSKIKESW